MKTINKSRKRNKKGIYILPNLFTSCSLFCGCYAIIAATQGRYDAAAVAILISSLLDGLDGKIARFTNTTSQFGIEYDSLSDLVAFGVAPGLLVFEWSLKPFGRFGWLAVFLFVTCGALRLARFNIQKGNRESHHFKGLPIPGAGVFIATAILFMNSLGDPSEHQPILFISAVYVLSFLMVSTIEYLSFKGMDLFRRKPFNMLVATILVFVVVAYKPALMLFLLSSLYVLSGPAQTLYRFIRKNASVRKPLISSSLDRGQEGLEGKP
jgi:CDP-diacylglycerol--serine O-phosphatidyltransferase